MRLPRRLLALTLALAAVVAAGPAHAIQVGVTPSSGIAAQAVDVPITVGSTTGFGIRSAQFDLTYNGNLITVTDVIEAGALVGTAGWGDATFGVDDLGGGQQRLRVAAAGLNALAGAGTMLFVRFVVNPAQLTATASALTLSNFDFNEGTPNDTTTSSTFTINNTPVISVSPNAGSVIRGNTLGFTVGGSVTNPVTWSTTNPAIGTMSGATFTGVGPGDVRVFAVDNAGRRDTTNADITVYGMGLSVSSTVGLVNNPVSVPIVVTSLNGLGIRSGQFTLSFAANRVVPAAVETPAGTLLNGWGTVGFHGTATSVTVDFAGTSDLTGSGVLCYVRFDAGATSGALGLTWANASFNETLPALTTSGTLTLNGLAVLTVLPDQVTLLAGQTQAFTVSGAATNPVAWSVQDPFVGSISPTGLFTALHGGTTRVGVVDAVGANDLNTSVTVYDFRASLPTVTANPGSTVLLPITSDRLLGALDIHSVQYAVDWTPTWITSATVANSGLIASWAPNVLSTSPTSGSLRVAAAGAAALSDAGPTLHGILFTISPSAPPGTNIPVTLTNLLCNEGQPIAQVQNGVIQVRTTSDAPGTIARFGLEAPEPNPLHSATTIAFSLSAAARRVALTVYTCDGRRVRRLHDGPAPAGARSLRWAGDDDGGARVPPGLYFLRLDTPEGVLTRKVAVLP